MGRLSIGKMSSLSISVYRFKAVPIIILPGFLVEILKLTLLFMCKQPRLPKEVQRKNRVGGLALTSRLTSKLCYQDSVLRGEINQPVKETEESVQE